jgi:ferredoxin--NADP+ reductase
MVVAAVSSRWHCLLLLATRTFLGYDQYYASAFPPRVLVDKSRSTTPLYVTTSTKSSKPSEIVAGGGVPLTPAGNRALFDPATAGRLDGASSTLNERIRKGAAYQFQEYLAPTSLADRQNDVIPPAKLQEAQHWLLEDLASGAVPAAFAKATAPVQATVLERRRLIGPTAEGDIQHVVMQLPDGMHYLEGQSLSVIPPGMDATTNRPHKPRLYSIASTRYGDDAFDGRTVSLCVRHAQYKDPVTGRVDESKNGVCSTFLCNVQPGTSVSVAGPVGKTMLLPSVDELKTRGSAVDLIMVATGTGIAPFRGFLRRLFIENTVARHVFQGKAWLVLGVPTSDNLLYQDEFQQMLMNAKNDRLGSASDAPLEVTYAISREMVSPVTGSGKCYVQDVLASRASELLERLGRSECIANMRCLEHLKKIAVEVDVVSLSLTLHSFSFPSLYFECCNTQKRVPSFTFVASRA